MQKGRIVILSGPSGSGKTTLYKKILADNFFKGKVIRSISATTRPRRRGEVHGRDYLFLSEKDFLSKKANGFFLETQKVYQDYYGTPWTPVQKHLVSGKHVLLCIEVKGAGVVARKEKKALRVFVKPPSLKVLKERLSQRNTEKGADLSRRFKRAKMELGEAKAYDYCVVNDDLIECYQELKQILIKELGLKKR